MQTRSVRARLLASTMIFGVAAAAASAAGVATAQTSASAPPVTPPPSADAPVSTSPASQAMPSFGVPASAAPRVDTTGQPANAVAEVVVTGSRIRQPNLTSTSPLTVVNSQEFKLEGTTRVEDLLNNLPQVFAGQAGGVSNGATGTATVNLRGLGDSRTLVLIDGRRLVPGDPTDAGADINFIPAALIQRVDIVTGGASSVYGSDAVSGVVNFIMQKDFQGLRIDATGAGFLHDNGNTSVQGLQAARGFTSPSGTFFGGGQEDVTAIIGVNSPDQKGNITAYAGYRHVEPVTQDNFDYSACSLAEKGSGFACAGSGTAASARLIPQTGPNAGNDLFIDPKTGSFRGFTANDQFNFAPYNYFQRPDTRYTAGAFAHYQVSPKFDAYLQAMFMDDQTSAQIAPSGLFGQTFNLPCNDPLLSAAQVSALCGPGDTSETVNILRRNVEGGGRIDERRHDDFRIVVGARGDLDEAWHYDVYGLYGQSVLSDTYVNDISVSRGQEAITGCTSGNTELIVSGCSPYNIFQPGGVTPAALNYIQTPGFQNATEIEQVVDASITGQLGKYGVKSPFATDGVGIALGTEYRRESLNYQTDAEFSSGDLAGQGGPKVGTQGSFDVYELFGEARIPVISDQPLIKDLSFDAAYRFSEYSTAGVTDTYSFEGNYTPVRDIRFRASYNRAVRAPNINELFTPHSVGLFLSSDPCEGPTPIDTAAQCARTGVSAAQYGKIVANSASQYNGLSGGNPNLKPERADTISGGFVFTPTAVRNFSMSVDYFNIFIRGVIEGATVLAQNTLNQCLNTGQTQFCDAVHRDPNTGSLFLGTNGYVTQLNANAGALSTSGVDVQADYRLKIPSFGNFDNLGSLAFNFVGTYLVNLTTEQIAGSGSRYNCAGEYGIVCGTPNPRIRGKFRVSYETPVNLLVSADVRYFGQVKSDGYNAVIGDALYPVDAQLPSRTYLDLTASYRLRDRYTFRIGVNNVFDSDPPLVGSHSLTGVYGNGNTFPAVYDSLGRYLFAGLTADF